MTWGRRTLRGAALACAALALGPAPLAAHLPLTWVPFVGCPSDGQTGPRRAPRRGPRLSYLATEYRGGLSFYGTEGLGVLAPSGWHCVAIEGSNGTRVIVTPERRRPADFLGTDRRIAGPAVEISHDYGGTSGRVSVASAIARYFPDHRAFAESVREAGFIDTPLPEGPRPADRIDRRGPGLVLFETPAGSVGEGTSGLLAPEGGAVTGALVLLVGEEPDLVTIRVRTPGLSDELRQFLLLESLGQALRGR